MQFRGEGRQHGRASQRVDFNPWHLCVRETLFPAFPYDPEDRFRDGKRLVSVQPESRRAGEGVRQGGFATPGSELTDNHGLPTFDTRTPLGQQVIGRSQLKTGSVPEACVIPGVIILIADEYVENHASKQLAPIGRGVSRMTQEDLAEVWI